MMMMMMMMMRRRRRRRSKGMMMESITGMIETRWMVRGELDGTC
jgi:hypothetical protein